jgi:hypothetical protein
MVQPMRFLLSGLYKMTVLLLGVAGVAMYAGATVWLTGLPASVGAVIGSPCFLFAVIWVWPGLDEGRAFVRHAMRSALSSDR